jgi:hypothetical protein
MVEKRLEANVIGVFAISYGFHYPDIDCPLAKPIVEVGNK